jgi:alcohol dehydrogenase class IV
MIRPFQFARLPHILFGAGTISRLPEAVRGFGTSVILVTGKKSFASSRQAGVLADRFCALGIDYQTVPVSGEPTVEMIDAAVARFRETKASVVVAIGGGSVLDAGKAMSAMFRRTESIEEFLEGVGTKEHPGTKLPFIAVPTTSGTGSEATKNAVISKTGENGYKRSLRHDHFVPDVALVDPELTLNCPFEVAAACGADCFVQLTEAYLSTAARPYTDALANEGLKAVKSYLARYVSDRSDAEAASGMAFAALTSGICLANAGLGVIHGFASSVGGWYDIPHGVICGSLMAMAHETNVRQLRKQGTNPEALGKYAVLGRLFLEAEGKSDDFYIDGFIDYLYGLIGDLRLPGLQKYGVSMVDVGKICKATSLKNNPVPLEFDDLTGILAAGI